MTATQPEKAAARAPGTQPPAPWEGFRGGLWRDAVDVRDVIRSNCTPHEGDGSFLAGPTERTEKVWHRVKSGTGCWGCSRRR